MQTGIRNIAARPRLPFHTLDFSLEVSRIDFQRCSGLREVSENVARPGTNSKDAACSRNRRWETLSAKLPSGTMLSAGALPLLQQIGPFGSPQASLFPPPHWNHGQHRNLTHPAAPKSGSELSGLTSGRSHKSSERRNFGSEVAVPTRSSDPRFRGLAKFESEVSWRSSDRIRRCEGVCVGRPSSDPNFGVGQRSEPSVRSKATWARPGNVFLLRLGLPKHLKAQRRKGGS
jgi:hypothetical protein